MSRAFYTAHADPKNTSNPNISESLAKGLGGVCILASNTPEDAVKYVRDYHNGFNGGAKKSFLQKLRDVEEVAWKLSLKLKSVLTIVVHIMFSFLFYFSIVSIACG